jgi:hypothetical protein
MSSPMRIPYILLLAVLVIALAITTNAVVRLENYRYANFAGFCSEYDITNPVQRIKREDCLENSKTRTQWLCHILYGVKIL